MAAEHVVHEVAELVEHRDDVVVLHQRGLVDRRIGEVADEHALGELLAAHAVLERELRRVLVLALARMHVEVDPAELLAAAHDVEHLHVGCHTPARRVDRRRTQMS